MAINIAVTPRQHTPSFGAPVNTQMPEMFYFNHKVTKRKARLAQAASENSLPATEFQGNDIVNMIVSKDYSDHLSIISELKRVILSPASLSGDAFRRQPSAACDQFRNLFTILTARLSVE